MQRFKIVHQTYYNFSGEVTLGPHELRLRPRGDHEIRIESSKLEIRPKATLKWHRDVEGNSVATASFKSPARQLAVESEVIVQQFNDAPLDFLVAPEAVHYPFAYDPDDTLLLAPYMAQPGRMAGQRLAGFLANLWQPGQPIQTYGLLERINLRIHADLKYQIREEPGVQNPEETLRRGTGSCRDFATLFMEASRSLGLASRFVSGYLRAEPSSVNYGSTHAWSEVYIPGAGWKGFDPTTGTIAGMDHFAVAVARLPESVPPISGSFVGPPGSSLDVGVWVTPVL